MNQRSELLPRSFSIKNPEARAYRLTITHKQEYPWPKRQERRGSTGPSVNGDRETGKLGNLRGKTVNWGIPGKARNDDQRLCKEDPPREPRYGASVCPAHGGLATEKEQRHDIDHKMASDESTSSAKGQQEATRTVLNPFSSRH